MFSTSKATQKDLQYQMKWTASVTNEDRRTTTLHWRLSYWMTTWLIQITYAVLFMFLWVFFRNPRVFCCPCLLILFLPVPIFFQYRLD